MVLFTEPVSRQNTFIGGTCAPPSALLVLGTIGTVVTFGTPVAFWHIEDRISV